MRNTCLAIIACLILSGCSKSDPAKKPVSPGSNTSFGKLYHYLDSTTKLEEAVTIDAFTHAYRFSFDHDGAITSIGYQGQTARDVNGNLLHKQVAYALIIKDSARRVLFADTFHFRTDQTEYKVIKPLHLQANAIYKIERTVVDYYQNFGNVIGRVLYRGAGTDTIALPYRHGDLTLYGGEFYSVSDSNQYKYGLPFIDIIFE